ncbi:UNVERIFIED_CONTAM: hypothetical protein Sradi_0709200 [Sesamum radiatum]|uniref:Uncharacterized protein n=1 Tax=Sesamum radiatum TaxID=300843 RepID=A0AAW2VRS6_SESRA
MLDDQAAHAGVGKKRLFHFEAMWSRAEGCEDIICGVWNSLTMGSLGYPLAYNLLIMPQELSSLERSSFDNVKRQVKDLEEKLSCLANASRAAATYSERSFA